MKFQYLAVIFVIIMLPITLVMSFYIGTQNTMMDRQNMYRAKLTDATYDAIKALQINTTNSYYSSVSDSKIRDIEAAVNSFYNSLTTSLKYSKTDLQSYVPAIVCSLYDGYYIYGKRYNVYEGMVENDEGQLVKGPIINETGELTKMNIVTNTESITDPELYEYGLKPFVYYSCQYYKDGGNTNFVVNYTLDNFISIYGKIDGVYYNKSGYLIQIDPLKNTFEEVGSTYKGITIQNQLEQLSEYLKFPTSSSIPSSNNPGDGEYNYVVYQNQKIYYYENNGQTNYFWYDQGTAHPIQGDGTIGEIKDEIEKSSSYEYYQQAYSFSKWVYDKLRDVKQMHIRTVVRNDNGEMEITNGGTNLDFNAQNESIFDTSKDPEDPASIFNQHRMAVIRNTIETNLAVAINSYNTNASSFAFALPRLTEEDWEKVVNNVCIISFMQGMPIGGKYFNDYVVVPNDKNKEFVDNDSIYLMTENGEYHMPNCPRLIENIDDLQNKIVGGYTNISFQRQTVDEQYYYNHRKDGFAYTPCYTCIVNSSGKYDLDQDIIKNTSNRVNGYDISLLRKRFFTILGREKNNLYKTSK